VSLLLAAATAHEEEEEKTGNYYFQLFDLIACRERDSLNNNTCRERAKYFFPISIYPNTTTDVHSLKDSSYLTKAKYLTLLSDSLCCWENIHAGRSSLFQTGDNK
jgi:hypothetical protein